MHDDDYRWISLGDAIGAILADMSQSPAVGSNVISFEAAFERRNRMRDDHATTDGAGSGVLLAFSNCVNTRCGGISGQAS